MNGLCCVVYPLLKAWLHSLLYYLTISLSINVSYFCCDHKKRGKMLFNSLQFLLFFPIVTILYFLLPNKFRWFHLLVASCIFYMAFVPVYILILFFTIIIDYIAGILIENAEGRKRKWFLVMSIV